MTNTEVMLRKAGAMGMEVSDEQYAYRESVAPQLIKVRTETHLGDAQAVQAVGEEGIKAALASQASAQATIAEAQTRRRNLILPLALVGILMGLLYAKLRQLE